MSDPSKRRNRFAESLPDSNFDDTFPPVAMVDGQQQKACTSPLELTRFGD
jgi:hypothetical protein